MLWFIHGNLRIKISRPDPHLEAVIVKAFSNTSCRLTHVDFIVDFFQVLTNKCVGFYKFFWVSNVKCVEWSRHNHIGYYAIITVIIINIIVVAMVVLLHLFCGIFLTVLLIVSRDNIFPFVLYVRRDVW